METKTCTQCGEPYTPTGRNQKVCASCKAAYEKQKYHEAYIKRYVQKGDYKWEMPKGKDSPFYTNGIALFWKEAHALLPEYCNRCGSTKNLCVHHRDRNRKNNDPSNWEMVCKSCHQKEHVRKSTTTGRYLSKA